MPKPQPQLSREAIFFMMLLSVQYGLQPILTRTYTSSETIKSAVILCQEGIKFVLAFLMLYLSTRGTTGGIHKVLEDWSISSWLSVAGLPAALYSVQNLAALQAYQNLDSLTFTVLNQTKTLSAALCCYLVLGKRQSKLQIFALLILLGAALVMERIITLDTLLWLFQRTADTTTITTQWDTHHMTQGVIPLLFASFLSGLAGALCQKNLQGAGSRNPFLFSMELCAASVLLLSISCSFSSDGRRILTSGFFVGWTPTTVLPIVTNALGGIVVGLVTKHAGSVRKGFALIFGIFLSGIAAGSSGVSPAQIAGGTLAGISLWIHATSPAAAPAAAAAKVTATTGGEETRRPEKAVKQE